MTQGRTIKPVSFSDKDNYEVELREFAESQSRYFGPYVKRLIADHRARAAQGDGLLLVSPVATSLQRTDARPSAPPSRSRASITQDEHYVTEAIEPSESSEITAQIERDESAVDFDFSADMSEFI